MNRATANYVLAAIFALGLASFGYWLWATREGAGGKESSAGTAAAASAVGNRVRLLFPGPDNRLHSELRSLLTSGADVETELEALVAAVLAGPETATLFEPFPTGTEAISILVTLDGTAFIDLAAPDGAMPPACGSTEELLTVYSLVNSVLQNDVGASRVVLLWNGQHRPTLAGHVDLTRPLTLHRDLIAPEPQATSGP